MNAKTHARYEAQARIVKAMAHASRLFIVDALARNGEMCVCDLTKMVGADISTVSRHLAVLKGAGLLHDEKRGQMVYYSLCMKCVSIFFDCIESIMECNAKSQQEMLN